MPVPLTKEPVLPNAVYFPHISITTDIVDGQLKSSCQLLFAAAKCENDVWKKTNAGFEVVTISDLGNLPADLAHLAPQIGQLYAQIVSLMGEINIIREVI